MSFRCDMCQKPADGKPTKIVTQTKEFEHPLREGVYQRKSDMTGEKEAYDDPGGKGTQIVKEVKACKECAKTWNKTATDAKEVGKKYFNFRPNQAKKIN